MSQYLSQIAAQVLRQEQRLTPQLIQSMDILQLPLLALEQRLQEEMEMNPALEVERPAHEVSLEAPSSPDSDSRGEPEPDDGFGRLEELSREYDLDFGDRPYAPRATGDGERDAKMDAMANTASRPISLQEYLLQQWGLADEPPEVKRAGEVIINQIDEDGYLRTPLEEIAKAISPPLSVDAVEEALLAVQELEPTGIGARDLQECLLLQLDALPGNHHLEERIIRRHLTDIEKNRYPAMAKALGCSIDDVKRAVANISRLHPHPGLLVTQHEVPQIVPDIIVDYDEQGDGYTVRLARGSSPRLRISSMYRRLLETSKNDRQARDFIKKNIEAASAIIDAVHYRRQRLLEVAKIVVQRQREFLDSGPSALKVLRMNDLADELHCDPSTISRTVAEKYMQTPRGIYPLRMFFTGGTETATGQSTSWDSVKARVKEIIDNEDKLNPLSDGDIAKMVQAEGIKISRRTIVKYREQLRIPTARQRVKY
jgi:RNA polymerase sigma-54 factor